MQFLPESMELNESFTPLVPPAAAFEFLSPLGEKRRVPEWNPQLLHLPGAAWERGPSKE
ncbi:MAG: hypothetical protein HY812_17460 [Planctomycetes bacterium]|nr:hypothetical protein [Planctomycetota bacterium]